MSGLQNFGLGLVNPATYTINHPIVYREVVHSCTLTFDQSRFRIIPTVSATTTYVLAEYIHLGNPRIICHLQPGHPLTMNTMPTYHFMVSNGQLLGPIVHSHSTQCLEALKYRKPTNDTIRLILSLFTKGHNPSSVKEMLEDQLEY